MDLEFFLLKKKGINIRLKLIKFTHEYMISVKLEHNLYCYLTWFGYKRNRSYFNFFT